MKTIIHLNRSQGDNTSSETDNKNQQPKDYLLQGECKRLKREILDISEREQCRIGQDLHDGLGQELAGIALLGKALANKLEAASHPLSKAAADLATYTNAAIESMRRIVKGLYPIELDRHGLNPALEELANQTRRCFGIRCESRQIGQTPVFEKSTEIQLYRIVQECIGNAIKHGGAGRITIESLAGQGVHTITVSDDGIGFEKSTITSGMGLHLMDYRARAIGAVIDMAKPVEGGCRVTCRLSHDITLAHL